MSFLPKYNLVDVGWMGIVGLEQRLECDHGVCVALEIAQHSTARRAKKCIVGKHLHKMELKQQRVGIGRYSLREVQQPSVVREIEKLVNVPLRHPLTASATGECSTTSSTLACTSVATGSTQCCTVLVTT